MKKLLFFFLIFSSINTIGQTKISGLVYKKINRSDKEIAKGTMVYAYPIKKDTTDFSYVNRFLEAISQYAKYKNSLFHSGKSAKGYKLAKKYRDSADIAFSKMMSESKKDVVNAQGEYSLYLANGIYFIYFFDPNYQYKKIAFVNYQGSVALVTKRIRSPLLNTKFYVINVEDSAIIINHIYK